MARRIEFQFGAESFTATVFDGPVAEAVCAALPIEGEFAFWGEEIYFDCGVAAPAGPMQATVAAGDVAYWPPGQAICLFWGRTPVSAPGEIRPASPVVVFGRLDGDPAALAAVTGPAVRVVAGDPS